MSLLLLLGGDETNPRSLFANNEPGVWFDPAGNDGASQSKIDSGLTGAAFLAAYPTHSLYTNTTGTSPAVYPGDLVALQIDQARGGLGNLGAELVVNGTFAEDATWSKGANWSIGSGVATKTGGAANNLTQTISSTAGQWYCVTMDVTRTAGTLTVSLGTSGTSFSTSATGSYKFYILAGSSTQTLTLAGDSSFAGTVDNVTASLIPGIHRYATTDANRPKLARIPEGGRRNLLTYTETMATQNVTVTAAQHTLSFRGTGTVTLSGVSTAGPLGGTGASDIVSLTFTPTAGTLTLTVTGTVQLAQLELGASRSSYQKVTLTEDVTETGKLDCWGLWYQGSQSMITPSVDFSGTDKMTVWAGVRKLSDAAVQIYELSNNSFSNPGVFSFNNNTSGIVSFVSAGTVVAGANTPSNSSLSPFTGIWSMSASISQDILTVRQNGIQNATSSGDQGSGNYGNYPLFFGRRNNATLPFIGIDFGTIIRGAATTDSTIRAIEKWMAQRAGITI